MSNDTNNGNNNGNNGTTNTNGAQPPVRMALSAILTGAHGGLSTPPEWSLTGPARWTSNYGGTIAIVEDKLVCEFIRPGGLTKIPEGLEGLLRGAIDLIVRGARPSEFVRVLQDTHLLWWSNDYHGIPMGVRRTLENVLATQGVTVGSYRDPYGELHIRLRAGEWTYEGRMVYRTYDPPQTRIYLRGEEAIRGAGF